jgi:hypothetical protein
MALFPPRRGFVQPLRIKDPCDDRQTSVHIEDVKMTSTSRKQCHSDGNCAALHSLR